MFYVLLTLALALGGMAFLLVIGLLSLAAKREAPLERYEILAEERSCRLGHLMPRKGPPVGLTPASAREPLPREAARAGKYLPPPFPSKN